MGKHTFFVQLAMTVVWVILVEELSWRSVTMGLVSGMVALHFIGRFLPYGEVRNVNFWKLLTYPFYLIGQIYLAGFQVIRIILKGSIVDVVTVETKIKEDSIRVILADSITLTPGSILLLLKDEFITLLWVRDKNTPGDPETASRLLKSKLERRLIKADKSQNIIDKETHNA